MAYKTKRNMGDHQVINQTSIAVLYELQLEREKCWAKL